MSRSGSKSSRRAGGFTLLEVMIAFTIAALALAALTRGAATGLQSADVAAHYQEAVSRAQSHLAVLNTYLRPGEQRGDDGGGFAWRMVIVPIASVAPDDAASGELAPRPTLYRATVTISWIADGHTRTVDLTTERLAASPPSAP